MTHRLVTGFLALLTLLLFAGFVLSAIVLFTPSGCSSDDIGCSAASSAATEIGVVGMVSFGPLAWVSFVALSYWRDR
jgi:hypothetical protein